MEVFEADLDSILPTQLYISKEKYHDSLTVFEKQGLEVYEPLPVKKIGSDIFFTDGHTRALVLRQKGVCKVRAYFDTDDMDWIMYLIDLQWCRAKGIKSIKDLQSRIVGEQEYKKKWIDRCSASHEQLGSSHKSVHNIWRVD